MPTSNWKLEILARRATFCAMALAGAGGTACDKKADKTEATEQLDDLVCLRVPGSVRPKGEVGSMGVPCLRAVLAPPSASAKLDHDYPFTVNDKGKLIANGTIRARLEGPAVPHAAQIATGSHLRARIRSCFIDAAHDGIKIEGKVELSIEISGDGKVQKVTTSGTLDPSLRTCLADKVKNLGFHPAGEPSKVVVELVF